MALTPPSLTRSPFSSSNTYCSSERSSPDYPSPPLDQHYKLASVYGTDSRCSTTPPMDSESSLPPFDVLCQAEWTGETVMHPSSSGATLPSILSAEYDTYGGYESTLPPPYGHDLYHTQHLTQSHSGDGTTTPPTGAGSRSPPMPSSRSYSVAPSMTGALTPRIKVESAEEYAQEMEMSSHYPSPRSVHTGFPTDTGYSSAGSGYLSDGQSSWRTPDYQPSLEPDQYYAGTPPPAGSPSAFIQGARTPYRVARPRRAPRRLTTREEANFQCEVKGCGKLFSRSYNYKAHLETHDEKREYPFPCTVADCNKKFVRKTDLQRHHQSVHMKERNHGCDFCSRLFARKDTLRRHMEDGCSKRFDIGTLDLRMDSYDARSNGGQMSLMVPSHGGLPPMSMPPLGSNHLLASTPPMRGTDQGQGHWGR